MTGKKYWPLFYVSTDPRVQSEHGTHASKLKKESLGSDVNPEPVGSETFGRIRQDPGGNDFGSGSGQIRNEFEIKLLWQAGKIFFGSYFFQFFNHQNSGIGIQTKMLDPDPESISPDPKHWSLQIHFPLNTIPPF
jgi:hypothetical protein